MYWHSNVVFFAKISYEDYYVPNTYWAPLWYVPLFYYCFQLRSQDRSPFLFPGNDNDLHRGLSRTHSKKTWHNEINCILWECWFNCSTNSCSMPVLKARAGVFKNDIVYFLFYNFVITFIDESSIFQLKNYFLTKSWYPPTINIIQTVIHWFDYSHAAWESFENDFTVKVFYVLWGKPLHVHNFQ